MNAGTTTNLVKIGIINKEGNFEKNEDFDNAYFVEQHNLIAPIAEKQYRLDCYNIEDVYKHSGNAIFTRIKKYAGFVITLISIGETRAFVYVIAD